MTVTALFAILGAPTREEPSPAPLLSLVRMLYLLPLLKHHPFTVSAI